MDIFWQFLISLRHRSAVEWSSVASSLTPHLMSTTWRKKLFANFNAFNWMGDNGQFYFVTYWFYWTVVCLPGTRVHTYFGSTLSVWDKLPLWVSFFPLSYLRQEIQEIMVIRLFSNLSSSFILLQQLRVAHGNIYRLFSVKYFLKSFILMQGTDQYNILKRSKETLEIKFLVQLFAKLYYCIHLY